MTIEEKARAYDEALEDMRVIYPNLKGDARLAVEHAFPELAESEDERIRKELVEAFEALDIDSSWNGIPVKSILAWLKDQKPAEWNEEELAKRHLEGYIMGREDTMREMKDFIESHFNTNKAREGEDLTDLYRKEYAQPLCLRNGGVCTNPMRDCINCIPTLERFNTSSGTSTLKAEG